MNGSRVVSLVAILLIASFCSADNIRYRGSGPWQNASDGFGDGWWAGDGVPGVVPGIADTARVNWADNTVTLDYAAPTIDRLQIGVDEPGTLEVNNGGILTATGGSKVGNNGAVTGRLTINAGGEVNANGSWLMVAGNSDVTGIVEINGGTLNSAGHLWAAKGASSTATIDINSGGVFNVGGILGLGSADFNPGGGIATLNVNDGGLLALSNIHGDGVSSIFPGSLLNVSGTGVVTLPGDFVGVLDDYIADGKIVANGGADVVNVAFDDVTTTLTVQGQVLLEADFNGDGDVDGDDFLLWQGGFGIQSGAEKTDGDYNNDGKVDGDDFLGWQDEFGSTGDGAGSAAVPEPASLMLVILGGLVAFCRFRGRA